MTDLFISSEIDDDSWGDNITLGGKAKAFQWKLDDTFTLHINRPFENGNIKFTAEQLDRIADYVAQNCEVALGNSVSKLADGTEREGLGKFMHNSMGLTITEAQTSSQLAALFVQACIWKWNDQKRGMTFRIIRTNWRQELRRYYDQATK
ncbi:hypothetical protein ACAW74_18575 [Fibrella sp. WM1]|uniref:hypothetical protein n=1 Tax=Fibrella musci TaxID=3242485 RepID=UPI003522BB8A